jgi:hypothetical protein
MLTIQKHECGFDGLVDHIGNAAVPTPDLIHQIITDACTRLPILKKSGKATDIDQLIEAGAWCDAALALIDIEIPAWSVRRLVREDGEWFCSLTRQPNVPVALDDTADASHQALPLAILGAFLEARRKIIAARDSATSVVPQVQPVSGNAICCDNFA